MILRRQVAVGHRGGDLGDVADLGGQVAGHGVHAVGEIFPRAGHAAHFGLAAQFAFGADFARHAGHFRREGAELVHHGVDRVLQLQNFAAHVHRDLARQVAFGDGGGHFRDVAHLRRQVGGHGIDAVGEILPGSGHAAHVGLAAEFAFGADFARDARHFRREGAELIDHGVDGVLQLREFRRARPP